MTDFWKIHLGRDLQKHVANQTVGADLGMLWQVQGMFKFKEC